MKIRSKHEFNFLFYVISITPRIQSVACRSRGQSGQRPRASIFYLYLRWASMQKIVLKVNYEGIQIKDLAPSIHPNSRSKPLLVLSLQLSFILTSLVCVRAQLESRPVSCTTCGLFTAAPPSNQADAVGLNCRLGI